MSLAFIYMTCADMKEAEKIAGILVKDKLIACANILDNMKSMYWWDGKIESGNEVVVIGKTKRSLVEEVIKKVRETHSYDCPCVVSLPIEKVNPAFEEWVHEVTEFKVV